MDLERALRNKSIAVLIKIRFAFTGFIARRGLGRDTK